MATGSSDDAAPSDERAREASDRPPLDVDECLDALAAALRTWGRLSLELPNCASRETSDLFEGWARHALLGEPPPEGLQSSKTARSWADLNRFVRRQRTEERDRVLSNLEDLHEVLWLLIDSLGKAATADRRGDGRVRERLEALRTAARSEDTGKLRAEANATAHAVEGVIDVRAARHRAQIELLSTKVEELSADLVDAQRKGAQDDLTGAYNRSAIDDYLNRVTRLGELIGSRAVLYLVDVDHFKWVNDRYGHLAGDEVLKQIVKRIRKVFGRREDFIGRYGGDEFIVVTQSRSAEEASNNGERILMAVRDVEIPFEGDTVRVSASIGGAMLVPGDDPKSWIARGDGAMYEAKRSGRCRVSFASDESDEPEGSSPPVSD